MNWPGVTAGVTVGVDVTSVQRIAKLSSRRPRFATKMFSPEEAAYCAGRPERLAARWAAKEAVRKVYGGLGWPIPTYPSVAVRRRPGGSPEVVVAGRAVAGLQLSLSHDSGVAVAVVVLDARAAGAGLSVPVPPGLALPDRSPESHKGTFGTVLLLAGSPAFPGAARLACMGALRGGAGKVKVVVGGGAGELPAEAIRVPTASGRGSYSDLSVQALGPELDVAQAVVCGPGLGSDPSLRGFLMALLEHLQDRGAHLLMDADALNAVARWPELRSRLPSGWIATPHPLEAARLLERSVEVVQGDRPAAARELAQSLSAVVVLKGPRSLVAGPGGELWEDQHATAALASGGTGDVLAGLVGALVAQGLPPFEAARSGVFLHAEAGSRLGAVRGRAGILASEVADALVEVQEEVRTSLEAGPSS